MIENVDIQILTCFDDGVYHSELPDLGALVTDWGQLLLRDLKD
jgi:hypothetical protein